MSLYVRNLSDCLNIVVRILIWWPKAEASPGSPTPMGLHTHTPHHRSLHVSLPLISMDPLGDLMYTVVVATSQAFFLRFMLHNVNSSSNCL